MSKYDPLTRYLEQVRDRDQDGVEVSFGEIDRLVGGLPASAHQHRAWWANNSHAHALSWRAAGFHVEQVYLERGRVRFAGGARGGTHHDRQSQPQQRRLTPVPAPEQRTHPRLAELIDIRVVLRWRSAGAVSLDDGGKPAFPSQEQVPGLYRLTFIGAQLQRPAVYIGESDNLRRRLSSNYRNPGPSQQTSLRVNARLREHLAEGGTVRLDVATAAQLHLPNSNLALDLGTKPGRLLAENAALVLTQVGGNVDVFNLG